MIVDVNPGWTNERVGTLKELWAEGLSASQIASQLGGITRNAVISKVHRIGLSGRATIKRKRKPARRKNDQGFLKNLIPHSPPRDAIRNIIQQSDKVSLDAIPFLELDDSKCRHPFGNPKKQGFGYCGEPVAGKSSYCRAHYETNHVPKRARQWN